MWRTEQIDCDVVFFSHMYKKLFYIMNDNLYNQAFGKRGNWVAGLLPHHPATHAISLSILLNSSWRSTAAKSV